MERLRCPACGATRHALVDNRTVCAECGYPIEERAVVVPLNPDGNAVLEGDIEVKDSSGAVVALGAACTTVKSTARVVSVGLVDGRLEVVRLAQGNTSCPTNPPRPVPDTAVWKEIYEAADGVIRLTRTVSGRHIPAHTTPERVEF